MKKYQKYSQHPKMIFYCILSVIIYISFYTRHSTKQYKIKLSSSLFLFFERWVVQAVQCGSGLLVVGGGDGGDRQGAGAPAQHAVHHAVKDEHRGTAGGRHQSARQVGLNSESIRAVPW